MCGLKATVWCTNPLLSPNKLSCGRFLEIEGLIADVTAIGSPDRAKRAILGVMLVHCFLPIQAVFVVGEPLCCVGNPT